MRTCAAFWTVSLLLASSAAGQAQEPLAWRPSNLTAPSGFVPGPRFDPFVQPSGLISAPPQEQVADPLAGGQQAPQAGPQQFGGQPASFDGPCPCCHCAPCECPVQPAPCIECPHVSTLLPFWNVNIFGALQGNMLFSTARPVAPGIPFFLFPGTTQPQNTLDIFARSSSIGALFTGPQIGQFRSGGLILAVFYNDALIVDRYGLLPIQAYGELRNDDWRLAAGLQFNVFNPLAPNMLTFGVLLGSGNAGNNFPGQFRVERYIPTSDDSQWTIQFALSDPVATGVVTNSPISSIITGSPPLRIAEDNGWPSLEGRVAYSVGEMTQVGLEQKRAMEVGASVVGSQLRTAIPFRPNVVANSFGLGTDFRWRINDRWGVQGEAFVGQALGFLNGGVLQSTNSRTFAAIRTRGAWGEVYYYIHPCLHTHWGVGVDNPIDRDLAVSQITRNEAWFANLIWDITRQLRVGFEVTWRETNYVALPDNSGAGLHTQVQWAF
jgi:hypothetical protein